MEKNSEKGTIRERIQVRNVASSILIKPMNYHVFLETQSYFYFYFVAAPMSMWYCVLAAYGPLIGVKETKTRRVYYQNVIQ